MSFTGWQEWVAWGGFVIPLCTLAWSAYHYVSIRNRENEHEQYRRFFEVIGSLGKNNNDIASKVVAAYELRKFIEYKDVIIRMLEQAPVKGENAEMLKTEMLRTAEYLKGK